MLEECIAFITFAGLLTLPLLENFLVKPIWPF